MELAQLVPARMLERDPDVRHCRPLGFQDGIVAEGDITFVSPKQASFSESSRFVRKTSGTIDPSTISILEKDAC